MNTHDILLTIQYITIVVLFIEIWIVFMKWSNPIHSYLFFACISSFISNMGYLLEMKATTEEAYLSALKLSYVGRVFIVLAFFLFSAKMCRIKIPKWVIAALMLVHIGIYVSILSLGSCNLYYTSYEFIPDPEFPRFTHEDGPLHDLLMAMNGVLACTAFYWVFREYRKEKNRTARSRLLMLMLAFGVQILSFFLEVTHVFPVSKYFDITMPGALFGTIFMLIGILGFDLLGTKEIARLFAIDRISEGIIAVDNEGRIQYYNEPAAKLYPELDAFFSRKKRFNEKLHHTEEPSRMGTVKSRVYTPYDIISFITDAVSKGETLKIGDRIYTPEENDLQYKGESYGKLYALVDDTDHFRYMEELQEQRDIADSANEAKSRFLANMSHEIRTPINAVLGMDEMILRESNEKEIRAYASDIMSAGRTLLSLINDILDLSKVEEGKMEIIPVQYDLSSLINDLVNMIRDRAANKGLKFNLNVDEHIPHLLLGDEIRIRQCAMNLLTNAVKYTEAGEVTLTLSYKKIADDHILLGFNVKDTGIGMKEEDMENLFSPYKRIEEKRNRTIEGTGLGMSITRQLLDLMGSSLDVHSEYGKGSEFSFEIDQEVLKWEEIGDYSSRFSEMAERTYEYHELFHAPDARILVVDDTEMNLTVIRSLLKKTGIRIDTADSGQAALDLAAENAYDLIFIDHMMPDMDGIETLQHIRESGKCTEVPAIALTANAVSGAREMYLEAGFTDYLSKPVDGEKLEKLLYEKIPKEKILTGDADAAYAEQMTGAGASDASGDGNGSGAGSNVAGGMSGSNGAGGMSGSNGDSIAWLNDIPEIDAQEGLKNCGSEEGYISVLSVFHQTAGPKADEIETLFRDNDIENYTIKVHALKSSARIIGAASLSEFAKDLEDAGKRNDTEYIESNTPKLLEMYRSLDAELSPLDGDTENLPEIDEGALKEAYQTIIEIAGSMDFGLMEDILKDLRGYRLPEADKDRIAKIEGLLTQLDWDGIISLAGERA
ncbi:MAG: response regulator [Lachnospiraceae bacterium]|nr:response regulator [Lachnospiraceae bacterium]